MKDDNYTVVPRMFTDDVKMYGQQYIHYINKQKKYPKNFISTSKYTKFNFLPLNVFHQLHRAANLYFLSLCIYNFIPQANALTEYFAILPVMFILTVTGIKDAYENYRREKSDNEINMRETAVMTVSPEGTRYELTEWRKLRPGDIIRLELNNVVPADILLLESSDRGKTCFVETANLDGETNLKQKDIILSHESEPFIIETEFKYFLHTEQPNVDLGSFNGYISHFDGDEVKNVPVKMKNLLLRGCVLRNTDYILGMVVYSGNQTKTMLNNGEARRKISTIDRLMAGDLMWCIIILCALCIISAAYSQSSVVPNSKTTWYIPVDTRASHSNFIDGFFIFLSMLIILQVIIPISLYVTLEIVKIGHVVFLSNDEEMFDVDDQKGLECRTSNITDELGTIQHVFSDKTGTLTENSMVFRKLAMDGYAYPHRSQTAMIQRATAMHSEDEDTEKLKKILSSRDRSKMTRNTKMDSESIHGVGQDTEITSPRLIRNATKKSIRTRAPRGHHRRVASEAKSIAGQMVSEDLDEIDFDNLHLESTVIPDPHLKSEMMAELAQNSGKFQNENSSLALDFFLSLAICNTVVISVEQQYKLVKNVKDFVPKKADRKKAPFKFKLQPIIDKLKLTPQKGDETEDLSANGKAVVQRKFRPTSLDLSLPGFLKENSNDVDSPGCQRSTSINRAETPTIISEPLKKWVTFDSGPLTSTSEACASQDKSVLNPQEVIYEAESPDEAALVYCAKGYGVTLMERDSNGVSVQWPNEEAAKKYQVMAMLPFDSHRKMMSVIIRSPQSINPHERRYILLTKGADSAVFARLRPDQLNKRTVAEQHVDEFAKSGLRTLAFGRRYLSESEVVSIKQNIKRTQSSIEDSSQELQNIYAEIERDLEYLGVTALEDRLQEGVPEAIEAMRDAGLAVWVLTGDKLQTALEIGRSCNLITRDDKLTIMSNTHRPHLKQQLTNLASGTENYKEKPSTCPTFLHYFTPAPWVVRRTHGSVIIVDGRNLEWIFEDESLKAQFISVSSKCDAVLCCRVTPLQKSEVVLNISKSIGSRTLAIGDGANDVSMIQAANIGVGISGKEGRQAVLASDFAIPKFHFIRKLLLVHGHWNYDRIAKTVYYFLFKNISFVLLIFFYQPLSGWSASRQIPEIHIMLYNSVYTSVLAVVVGLFEQNLSSKILMENPIFYQRSSMNKVYIKRNLFLTILDSFYQAGIQFSFLYLSYNSSTGILISGDPDSTISIFNFGQLLTLTTLISQFISFAFIMNHFTWFSVAGGLGSLLLFIVIDLVWNAIQSQCPYLEYWSMQNFSYQILVYLNVVIIVVVSCLPRIVLLVAKNTFCKCDLQRYREDMKKKSR